MTARTNSHKSWSLNSFSSVMDRIELDSIVPVEEMEETNSPPPYDAAVKKNNYFPEVLMHQNNKTAPSIVKKRKRPIQSGLPFLKLVWPIIITLELTGVDLVWPRQLLRPSPGVAGDPGGRGLRHHRALHVSQVSPVQSSPACMFSSLLFVGLAQCCSSWWTMSSAPTTTSPWRRSPSRERTFPRWVPPQLLEDKGEIVSSQYNVFLASFNTGTVRNRTSCRCYREMPKYISLCSLAILYYLFPTLIDTAFMDEIWSFSMKMVNFGLAIFVGCYIFVTSLNYSAERQVATVE